MALGVGLQRAGFRVRILTSADFIKPLEGMGLEAVATRLE